MPWCQTWHSRDEGVTKPYRSSGGHGPLDCFELFGREGDRGVAAVELLHVDTRVVAALDGAQDDARSPGVEQGDRGRLVPAGVLVRVVADDRRLRDRLVDAPLEPLDRPERLV